MDYPIVPVLMFHMVTDNIASLPRPWLATPVWLMETYLKYLHSEGFSALSLGDLYQYLDVGKKIPERSVILTFDDGYLDNWVIAYPLLKKFNMKAVVWVSSDFVVKSSKIRPTMEDVDLELSSIEDMEIHGYLTEGELIAMENSGVFEIGVHCKTHGRIFKSNKIIDYHHPTADNYWLAWNKFPDKRLDWLVESINMFLLPGTPIYEHGLATCNRQYFPDNRLEDKLLNFVRKNDLSFFENKNWKKELDSVVSTWRATNQEQGRYETDEELRQRLWQEIQEPKKYLDNILKRSIDFLCWPGGGSSPLGIELARKAGFLATTVRSAPNQYGKHPEFIDRVSIPFINTPLFPKQINKIMTAYVINHVRKEKPYYQIWALKNMLRGSRTRNSIQFSNNDMRLL